MQHHNIYLYLYFLKFRVNITDDRRYKMSIVKEYEFNSAVFVLYDVIYALEGT